mmetsp:Transcript_20422/g.33587  ORF Transcript_20422/g.33587 Transcript_20422/m.33587 type:complete len:141 (-) Transcript_20422:374-796(-)|eukprot:CAMPEP_0184660490 /NCGR_PEP_ID=MMETSP0308-20130426/34138_1 /TAXON_ID=38269 /ORGANISM="Gloeochaete witrockiana, Strain SAG 46.84" /LENGTH=140 /DNA_ID=CAMNT_0027101119 /DNA_START=39 /DNA_END=461 /DNA_ORIENTATION=+
MAGKPKDYCQEISEEDVLKSEVSSSGLKVVEAYSSWCGSCKCIGQTFKAMYFDLDAGERLKFLTAEAKIIPEVRDHHAGSAKPLFLFYRNGRLIDAVSGVDSPLLRRLIPQYLPRQGDDKSFSVPPEAKTRLQKAKISVD